MLYGCNFLHVVILFLVGSWFLSPVLAGLMAAGCYFLLRIFIFQKVRFSKLALQYL